MRSTGYFLIAMLGLGIFGGGLSGVVTYWLIYTFLLRGIAEQVRNGIAATFAVTAAVTVFLLILMHVFINAVAVNAVTT